MKTALLACALTMGVSGTADARQITSIRLESTIIVTPPSNGADTGTIIFRRVIDTRDQGR